MRFILALMVTLLLAGPVYAGAQAPKIRTSQGHTFLMCDNETTSGVPCATASGDTFAFVYDYDRLTFMFRESGTAATCEVYAVGHYDDDGNATDPIAASDLESFTTDSMISSSLSITQSAITLTDVDFNFVFVTCTTSGMDVTVEMRASYRDNPRSR